MKKGINFWCFPEQWSLEKKLSLANTAGFHGVELNVEESGMFSLESTVEEIKEISKLVSSYHLEIISLSTGLFWKYPLSSKDVEVRKKAQNVIKRMIDMAKMLDIDTILVVPGMVNEDIYYDEAYQLAKESLIDLAKYAENNNVTIAIENVWNKFLLSPLEMKRFIEEINSTHVKAYFDVGNILNFGFPEQWISILGSYIQRIHLKDFKKDVGNIHGFTTLLHGDVNWVQVMKALKAIQYDGYVTAEVMPYQLFTERFIYELSESMEVIIQGGKR